MYTYAELDKFMPLTSDESITSFHRPPPVERMNHKHSATTIFTSFYNKHHFHSTWHCSEHSPYMHF